MGGGAKLFALEGNRFGRGTARYGGGDRGRPETRGEGFALFRQIFLSCSNVPTRENPDSVHS